MCINIFGSYQHFIANMLVGNHRIGKCIHRRDIVIGFMCADIKSYRWLLCVRLRRLRLNVLLAGIIIVNIFEIVWNVK